MEIQRAIPPDLLQFDDLLYITPLGLVTTFNPALGVLRVTSYYIPKPTTFDRVGMNITGAGAGSSVFPVLFRQVPGRAYPGVIALDPGALNGDVVSPAEISVEFTLEAGLYYGGAVSQNGVAPSVSCVGSTFIPMGVGMVSVGSSNSGYQQSGVTGARPSTFTQTKANGGSTPMLWLRKKAG